MTTDKINSDTTPRVTGIGGPFLLFQRSERDK